MRAVTITASFLVAASAVVASPTLAKRQAGTTATYVADIATCPNITRRDVLSPSVHDARPDEFGVFMALGDSITAGAFAEGLQPNVVGSLKEWRGVSYAAGGDLGAITIPNLIGHYRRSRPKGASVGSHGVQICFGVLCPPGSLGWTPKVDQFNAALFGALAVNLYHEAKGYLVPQYKASGVKDSELKYLNLQIGSNDVCQLCAAGAIGSLVADLFEKDVRKTLEHVRQNIPNVLVNVVGLFRVSQIYPLTTNQPWCDRVGIPGIPHLNIECSCALLGGSVGNATRTLMDNLTDQYNTRLVKIVKEYQRAAYPGFAAIWQPADLPLTTYPVQALSDVDCFHPSKITHQRIARHLFNRLTLSHEERSTVFDWQPEPKVRCLQETDRIKTKALLG